MLNLNSSECSERQVVRLKNTPYKKAPISGAFLYGASRVFSPCSVAVSMPWVPMPHLHATGKKARWAFLPRSRRDTSRRELECAARGQGGGCRLPRKVATPRRPPSPESENNPVRFLFRIDFQYRRPRRHCRGLR